ncbi:MAG: hypothetical protein K2X66_01660 [Cyanobacteria bacterium]|nr:hypothetical protein [Cyanobacteriota bacterium]
MELKNNGLEERLDEFLKTWIKNQKDADKIMKWFPFVLLGFIGLMSLSIIGNSIFDYYFGYHFRMYTNESGAWRLNGLTGETYFCLVKKELNGKSTVEKCQLVISKVP